ncbi:MAG: hypothetical protein WAW37_01050 [Syntrophobacteraceae bacterium]
MADIGYWILACPEAAAGPGYWRGKDRAFGHAGYKSVPPIRAGIKGLLPKKTFKFERLSSRT